MVSRACQRSMHDMVGAGEDHAGVPQLASLVFSVARNMLGTHSSVDNRSGGDTWS